MKIKFVDGNLLESDAQALVNTVNCIGVMGKGIALQFKKQFPDMYKAYNKACDNEEIKLGRMWVYPTNLYPGISTFIINFPTKDHWRNSSKIEWIEKGLQHLIYTIAENEIYNIAIPALGCGNGDLDWKTVKKLMKDRLRPIQHEVDIIVYNPQPN